MEHDDLIVQVARRQHGVIAAWQLAPKGLEVDLLRRRASQGRIERIHRGVYRVAGAPRSRHQRLMAAVLACGPNTIVSHRAAAEMWEMDGVEPGHIEVTVQQQHKPRHAGIQVHRTKDLREEHKTLRHGIAVTNPLRTLVDLGAVCPRQVVEQALDSTLGRKLVSVPGVVRIWRDVARPGRNGSGVLRSLIENGLPPMNLTVLERKMERLHRRHGLPRFEMQYAIHDDEGRFMGRMDFVHPEARLIVETDGFEKRAAVGPFTKDRRLDRRLKLLGWTIIRFTWMEVCHTPDDVAAEIAAHLAQASASASR